MIKSPTIVDRLVAGFTYLTSGIFGIVWLFVCAVRKSMPNKFVMYHIMQSIFLSLCFVALNFLVNMVVRVFEFIPFINRLVRQIVFLFNMPVFFGYSVIQCVIYAILIYIVATALMGLYSYIPFVSDLIKKKFGD